MNPTTDMKGEHAAITIMIEAMKALATNIRYNKVVDLQRADQIIDFLHVFTDRCHYEKEEKSLFPALQAFDIPWILKMIQQLVIEHATARSYIDELDDRLRGYRSGNKKSLESLSDCLIKYATLEEYHIKTEENIVLPMCEKLLDKKKLLTITSDFKKIQNQEVGHIKHMEYYLLLSKLYNENQGIPENNYQD